MRNRVRNSTMNLSMESSSKLARLRILLRRACAMIVDRLCIYGAWLLLELLSVPILGPKRSLVPMPNPDLLDVDNWPWVLVAFMLFVYGLPGLRNVLIISAYMIVTLALCQASPGMRGFGLCIKRWDGNRVSWPRVFVWHLVSFLSGLCLGTGYLWALFDARGRTWHDIAAGVLVIRRS